MKKRILAGILAVLLIFTWVSTADITGAALDFPEFTDGEEWEDEDSPPLCHEEPAEQETFSMSMEALGLLDEETVSSAVEYGKEPAFFAASEDLTGDFWRFDAYYVNQDSPYHVKKTEDFHLKYQYEFHTDRDLDACAVEIRFPAVLLKDRMGNEVLPSDIGVPRGIPQEGCYTPIPNSPFNYFTENQDLVFFNYRPIPAGTNTAVQVLYKNLKVLELTDLSAWELLPRISVITEDGWEEKQGTPLTGQIDTSVSLIDVYKTPLKEPDQNYTPGLYTREQVMQYLDVLPPEYEQHFTDYAFALWKTDYRGSVSQAWELYLTETPEYTNGSVTKAGTVVGMQVRVLNPGGSLLKKYTPSQISEGPYSGQYRLADYLHDFPNRNDIRLETYIVTACPANEMRSGTTILNNRITALLHPADGMDEDQILPAEASWTWVDYAWNYRGNTIGVTKSTGKNIYAGWLDTYRQAQANGQDLGGFSFYVKGDARIYGFTHRLQSPSPGQYIEGNYCEIATADDVIYAYPLTGTHAGEKLMLDSRDYYFSEIQVSRQDQGYDPFEDKPAPPESISSETDRSLHIYAMFVGSNRWEEAAVVPWDSSGRMEMVFPGELLARQPWRVKAVYHSMDYQTRCDIRVTVKIRRDSPVFETLCADVSQEDHSDLIRLENLCAITGKSFSASNQAGTWFHDQSVSGDLYRESGLISQTQELYGTIAMRDSVFADLSALEKHAQAQKYARAVNDSGHRRIRIRYTASAFESYLVYSEEALAYLKNKEFLSPERREAVFYDLLPYGVQLDPSEPVSAGRLDGVSEAQLSMPSSWNMDGVSVYVDSDTDIVRNFRGTGRTLIRFHISDQGESASVFANGLWMAGYGISFSAYCSWEDIPQAEKVPNICAYMPETGDLRPLLGTNSEVSPDDGSLVSSVNPEDYRFFGADINDDGITGIRNVLYCRAAAFEDIATASESGIHKTVRADDNRFGVFEQNAVTGPKDGYTYQITVTNTSRQNLTELVVFDRLEHAAADRKGEEADMAFEDVWWTGSFAGVDLSSAELLGIRPVIYFHGDRTLAPVPHADEDPRSLLNPQNGWYTSDTWQGTYEEVQAVAVDLSRKQDGSDFALGNMEAVSFYLHMKAPKETGTARYAYNNSAFSSLTVGTSADESVRQTVQGNSTRVRMDDSQILEVQKELGSSVPSGRQKEKFLFTASVRSEEGIPKPYASREYGKYQWNGSLWEKQTGLYATDAGGRFYLRAGEKAVFRETAEVSGLEIAEEENPFWKSSVREELTEKTRTLIFTNDFRPVLYLQKKITAYPAEKAPSEAAFRVQLLCNGSPLGKSEFWYVDRAAFYGTIPAKLGTGITDENGMLTLHPGEILALFPGAPGDSYQVIEQETSYGPGTDWIGSQTVGEGALSLNGNSEILENIYKWKELLLSKKLKNQDAEDCTAEFTFRIYEASEEKPVSGLPWELLDSDKKPLEPPVSGVSGEDGKIRCPCAGKLLRISRLEAGKSYRIEETDIPQEYQPENSGFAEVTMPVYSTGARAEITNNWLFRDLKVSKLVLALPEQTEEMSETSSFEMTLLLKEKGEFLPKGDFPYEVRKNGILIRRDRTDAEGHFFLSGLETAEFRELGLEGDSYRILETPDDKFPPVYPAKGSPVEGVLGKQTASVRIINGMPGCLSIRKEFAAEDEETELMLTDEAFQKESFLSAELHIEFDRGKGFEPFEGNVLLIENATGEISSILYNRETPLMLRSTQTAVLTGLEEDVRFRIREDETGRHRTLCYGKNFLLFDQIQPEQDQPETGIIGQGAAALFVNRIRLFQGTSSVYKQMTGSSEPLPDGAQLVYRVERYDSRGWFPAAGVRYIVNRDSGSDLCSATDASGLIRLYAKHSVFPSVHFEEKVYVHPEAEPQPGTLRIVELPELSDKELGILTGYSTHDYYYFDSSQAPVSFDVPPELADTFVNSNALTPVEVEKRMSTGTSDQDFLMEIRPLGGAGYAGAEAGALPYTVYNSLTGEKLYESMTNDEGEFPLKAGQYARFSLCTGSAWNISEKLPYPYSLESVCGEGTSIEVRKDDSANVYLNQKLYHSLLTREMIDCGVYDPATGEKVNLTHGSVAIPSQVLFNGKLYALYGIARDAYRSSVNLTEVIIPEGFTTLEMYSFYRCPRLKKVHLPSTLTELKGFDFYDCSQLESISLPEKLKVIPSYAFTNCVSLKEIVIPPGLTSIGGSAFQNCVCLTNLFIPDSVTYIGSSTFRDCRNLEEIRLPSRLTALESSLFSECVSLKNIGIPDTVKVIQDFAFSGCRSLTDVFVPDAVKKMGDGIFQNCRSLKEVHLSAQTPELEWYVFSGCERLTQVMIPESVSAIDRSVFLDCIRLSALFIDKEEGSIAGAPWGVLCPVYWRGQSPGETPAPEIWDAEDENFYYSLGSDGRSYDLRKCKDRLLQTAMIPQTVNGKPVRKLGKNAFLCCENLQSVSIPEGVELIGDYCFSSCGSLEEIYLPDSVNYIGSLAFSKSGIRNIRIPAGITYCGDNILRECRNLETVVLHEGLEKLGQGMFQDCVSLREISLPGTLTSLPQTLFAGCTGLTEIIIPDSVSAMGISVFEGCTALAKVNIPPKVSVLPYHLFYGCKNLKELAVPETVSQLDRYVFAGTGLKEIYLPDSITSIGDCTFESCINLTSVRLPEGLTVISSALFQKCTALESIALPPGITAIRGGAFDQCIGLKELTVPSAVSSMGYSIFEDCSNLTRIIIRKPQDSLTGAPWAAPNRTLSIKWTGTP